MYTSAAASPAMSLPTQFCVHSDLHFCPRCTHLRKKEPLQLLMPLGVLLLGKKSVPVSTPTYQELLVHSRVLGQGFSGK